MQRVLFVANFDESVEAEDLNDLFSRYGKVSRARVWFDLETGESRGFGFVDMEDEHEAKVAIECLDGQWWRRRRLRVSFARPRANARFG
jgi:RNA recognition motif-containing protein